jgi:AcrR family transcriptional regulator
MTPDETRARILEAADGLFGTLGFDATTTRDIAEKSGVNKALIHYHYGSKDELLATLLDGYYARLSEALAPALTHGGTPLAQVESVLDTYADFLAANLTFCRIVSREVASGRHMARIVERTWPVMKLSADWLAHAAPKAPVTKAPRGDGVGGMMEAAQVLTSIYGMVVTYFTHGEVVRHLTGQDPFSPRALAARKRHVRTVAGLLLSSLTKGTS